MTNQPPSLPFRLLLTYALAAAGCYHLAMICQPLAGWFVMGYLGFLWQLRLAETPRKAFYIGWLVGLIIMVPQTWFITGLFHILAVALWLLMSVWLGLIACLWRAGSRRWGLRVMGWLAPLTMLGVEYFRAEIWPLRFTWDTAGFALPAVDWAWGFWLFGVYGLGAVLLAAVICGLHRGTFPRVAALAALPLIAWPLGLLKRPSAIDSGKQSISLAGVQWEEASEAAYLKSLDAALLAHPQTQVFVCSEYSFAGPPTKELCQWALKNNRYLLTGGIESRPKAGANDFFNTAFLIGPDGKIVHKQAKAVPIQFTQDGQPAQQQTLWESPWGKVGVCICYDMNYTKVMDELVRQGAEMVIIPAMDKAEWGYAEHVLSARLGATRAAEYGIPIFRLASSGISQMIFADGSLAATGSYPGQGELVVGTLPLGIATHLPLDRYLALPAVFLTGGFLLGVFLSGIRSRLYAKKATANAGQPPYGEEQN